MEKIVKYEVKMLVKNHNSQHIKRFENLLMKMVNNSAMNQTELSSVREVK